MPVKSRTGVSERHMKSSPELNGRFLVCELLQLSQRWRNDYITGPILWLQRNILRTCRQTQPVDGLDKISLFIKDLNTAAARRCGRYGLADQKQLVHGVECDPPALSA